MYTQFEEKGKIFTQVVNKEPVEVLIQTSMHRIQGVIHVIPEGRLRDELNQNEPFLPLTDVKVMDLSGNVQYQTSFLAINRSQIHWVLPIGEVKTEERAHDSE